MEIAADAGQQGKFTGQNGQTADLFGRLHAIHHFQGLTAGLAAAAVGLTLPGDGIARKRIDLLRYPEMTMARLARLAPELDAIDQAIGILAAEADGPARDTASRAIDVAVVVADGIAP